MLLVTLTSLCLWLHQASGSESGCTCWEGYKPERIGRNVMQCTGIDISHAMSCNVLEPPKCVCSGRYNGILKDRMGTWCTIYLKGSELKRWRCENHDEWQRFFQQLHNQRKLAEYRRQNNRKFIRNVHRDDDFYDDK